MKFSISSFNPIAWLNKPPMSEKEILIYDLNQKRSTLNLQLRKTQMIVIDLNHQYDNVAAQLDYVKVNM